MQLLLLAASASALIASRPRAPRLGPLLAAPEDSATPSVADDKRRAREAAARARDAEAFKGGMTVKEINAAFGERAGELKKPAKRVGLIDMGLIHLFMM